MSIAQKLYEGIDIGTETVGLITYMRTDSIRLSPEFTSAAMDYIEKTYGKEYVGSIKVSKRLKMYRMPMKPSVLQVLSVHQKVLNNILHRNNISFIR